MKRVVLCLIFSCLVGAGFADTLIWEGATGLNSVGEFFESVDTRNSWSSTNLISSGVTIFARTDNANHRLNANYGEFGIDSDLVGDVAADFDVGETMVLKFSEKISLDFLDFNSFENGDEFVIAISGQVAFTNNNSDLHNGSTDVRFLSPGIVVEKDTEVSFFASAGSIGLDSMDITVIPEPAVIGLISMTAVGGLIVRRFTV